MSKKVGIVIILILVVVLGGLVWLIANKTKTTSPALQSVKDSNNDLVLSEYGFKFSVPVGWHILEGNSAALDLSNKTDFVQVMSSSAGAVTDQKATEYQTFMNNWSAQSSSVVVFTASGNVDYKFTDRNLANAGKMLSIPADSEDMIKRQEVIMNISDAEVNLNEAPANNEQRESGKVKIKGIDASFAIGKKMKNVDAIIIKLPINSSKTISGKKVSSLVFMTYVKKNNPNALTELTSFISSLGISSNQ